VVQRDADGHKWLKYTWPTVPLSIHGPGEACD
jgi:hypothetical protein